MNIIECDMHAVDFRRDGHFGRAVICVVAKFVDSIPVIVAAICYAGFRGAFDLQARRRALDRATPVGGIVV